MTSIVRAAKKDIQLLSEIAEVTFIESHGRSANAEDIRMYISEKYNEHILKDELSDPKNIYHIIYYNNNPAGYSKIIFDAPYAESKIKNITKLERIYLLKEYYDLQLGSALFQFNIDLSKSNNQMGMWLYVWKENPRAVNFYKKHGFVIIGSHDFKISENHSNPNHQMLLNY